MDAIVATHWRLGVRGLHLSLPAQIVQDDEITSPVFLIKFCFFRRVLFVVLFCRLQTVT